jgi:proteasome lid subunit RPN8/RPN11
MIEIHHSLLERICQHAKEIYPNECCGIIIGRNEGRKRVNDIFETENAEVRRRRDRYVIDGRDFLGADKIAERKGLEIIGFYHSHPGYSCIPSSTDQKLAWPGYSYLIVSLQEGKEPEFKSWVLEENGKGWIEERICETGSGGG